MEIKGGQKKMNKELEALQKLRDLVEFLTRIDYVPTDLRNEVKELLIKSYEDSNGYFSQIEEALKRSEPMKVDLETILYLSDGDIYNCPKCGETFIERWYNYCPDCGQKLDWSDDTAFFLNESVGDDSEDLYYYWYYYLLGVSEITKQNILNLKQLLGDDDEPI